MSNGNQTLAQGKFPPVDQLTPTEQKIADLLKQGKTQQEIADALGVKKNTIQCRMAVIHEKLQTNRGK